MMTPPVLMGGMPVAIYVYRGCHHPIAFLIIRFSGILNGASLVFAGIVVHVMIMHRASPLSLEGPELMCG